jgi:hypothetical protein
LWPRIAISPTSPTGTVLAPFVDQAHLDAPDRGADGAGLAHPVGVVERRHRRGLGQAVPLQDDAAEEPFEAAHDLDRQCRATGDAQPQGRHVELAAVGRTEQRDVHRGYALEDGHPITLQHLEHLRRGEPGHERQAGAHADGRVEPAGLPERVEERQPAEDDVVRAEPGQIGREDLDVGRQVGVGELGSLGLSRCARGVEDDRGVVRGTGGDARLEGRRCEVVGEPRVHQLPGGARASRAGRGFLGTVRPGED